MPQWADILFGAASSDDSSSSSSSESELDVEVSDSVVDVASPSPSPHVASAAVADDDDDDDDIQILTEAEAAAEVAAAAQREAEDPNASRKRKRPRVETRPEPTECTICCEDCTIVGRHRLVALKCGHLFGRKCIERWVSERHTCPNCSARVKRTDICLLFSDHVAVVDNAGLEDMTKKFEEQRQKCTKLEKDIASVKQQLETKTTEAARMQGELAKFKKFYADVRYKLEHRAHASASELNNDAFIASIRKYKPVFDAPLLSARVFSIAQSCAFVCIGEKLSEGSHGIMMLTSQDPTRGLRIPAHSSDLAVTSLRDKKVVVQVIFPSGRRQGWSCGFSEADPYAMYSGFQDGSVAKYDMRKPAAGEQGIVKNFSLPERQPVHSIKLFRGHQEAHSEGLAAATFRGLSVWKDVADVASDTNRPVGNGSIGATPFSHAPSDQACFSLASNQLRSSQMVVSSRATPTKHSVFDLQTIGRGQLAPATEFAGHKAPSVLSRSAVWSEADGTPVMASWSHDAERVTLWNVANHREAPGPEPTALCVASTSMPVVDIQHAVASDNWSSGTALFGTMTSRQLCVYRVGP
uniref:RING-type E3 ubiquitin transferase n=1 Tax=Phytophthora ramorum TaxID=164328 RepID=H3HAS4_PHYRM